MRKLLTMNAVAAAALMLCSCSLMRYDNSGESSSIGGYEIPPEFTEEEREMQKTINQVTYPITSVFGAFGGYYEDTGEPSGCKVFFEQPGDKDGEFVEKTYKITYSPSSSSLEDFKNELKDSLTSGALEKFAENFAFGEEVEKKSWEYWYNEFKENDNHPDIDTIAVTVTEGNMLKEDGTLTAFPHMIKLENLALYDEEAFKTVKALDDCFWKTAHITEKTDDTIKFAYIVETEGILTERTGILKNEDGWKLSWYMDWLE